MKPKTSPPPPPASACARCTQATDSAALSPTSWKIFCASVLVVLRWIPCWLKPQNSWGITSTGEMRDFLSLNFSSYWDDHWVTGDGPPGGEWSSAEIGERNWQELKQKVWSNQPTKDQVDKVIWDWIGSQQPWHSSELEQRNSSPTPHCPNKVLNEMYEISVGEFI